MLVWVISSNFSCCHFDFLYQQAVTKNSDSNDFCFSVNFPEDSLEFSRRNLDSLLRMSACSFFSVYLIKCRVVIAMRRSCWLYCLCFSLKLVEVIL